MKKPKNLKECIEELDSILSKEDKKEIKKMDKDEFAISQHMGMSMGIRNSWGLWDEKSKLYKYFKKHLTFAYHADEASGLILRTFHEYLNGRIIDFDTCIVNHFGIYDTQKEFDDYLEKINNKVKT